MEYLNILTIFSTVRITVSCCRWLNVEMNHCFNRSNQTLLAFSYRSWCCVWLHQSTSEVSRARDLWPHEGWRAHLNSNPHHLLVHIRPKSITSQRAGGAKVTVFCISNRGLSPMYSWSATAAWLFVSGCITKCETGMQIKCKRGHLQF